MNRLSELPTTIARLLDLPLDWLLALPRELAIVLLAVGTSLLMVLARKWYTNQDLLRRTTDDLARLKTLMREAKKNDDKDALARMRGTMATIKTMRLAADCRVLIVSLIPMTLLAIWAVERLDYYSPQIGETLTLTAQYPLSSVDQLTHLVPPAGVKLNSNAVQLVQVDALDPQHGTAHWIFEPAAQVESLPLVVRHNGNAITHVLNIGGRTYTPPVQLHAGTAPAATAVELRQARFLGWLPGVPQLGLAPWLVAYVLLSLMLVPLLRRLLHVY